jgi:small-conductance mechanosensitive channel
MNPIIKKKIQTIESKIHSLEQLFADNQADLETQHEEKEDLLQEKWQNRRKLTTLERISTEYDSLEKENVDLLEERKKLRDYLTTILTNISTLQGLK